MNKDYYNEYMLNLFKECTFKIASHSTDGDINIPQQKVEDLFAKASSVFNNGMAIDYLTNISNISPTIIHKLYNFPSTFWKTPESEDQIILGMQNFINSYTNKIDKEIEDFKTSFSKAQEYEDLEYKEQSINFYYEKLNKSLILSGLNDDGVLVDFGKSLVKIYSSFPAKNKLITNAIKTVSNHLVKSLEKENINLDLIQLDRFASNLDYLFKDLPFKEELEKIQIKTLLKCAEPSKPKL